jgi:Cof subfamily protein (haloacid dehalogenase superfamily)
MPIRLVACDIDGTLLDSQHKLSQRNKDALTALKARGIPVILATGRTRNDSVAALIAELGLDTPGIFMQGSLICAADGTELHRETLPPDFAHRLYAQLWEQGYTPILYQGLERFTARRDAHTDYASRFGEGYPHLVDDIAPIIEAGVFKMIVWHAAENIRALRAWLDENVREQASILQALPLNIVSESGLDAVEILPKRVSKGSALRWIAHYYNIKTEDILALGDGENDVEMLAIAGVGVAMANASQTAKQVADAITTSNDEDGVAAALEQFILSRRGE